MTYPNVALRCRRSIPFLLLAMAGGSLTHCKPSASSSSKAATPTAAGDNPAFVGNPFVVAQGQFPTGITFSPDHHYAYVAYSPIHQIVRITLPDGQEVTSFGQLKIDPQVTGAKPTINGIESDADGNIYIGVFSHDGVKVYQPGIYRLPPTGGDAELYAKNDDAPPSDDRGSGLRNPNKMVFDDQGNLYVTDSWFGGVYRVAAGPWKSGDPVKKAESWSLDQLLKLDANSPCNAHFDFPFALAGITRVGKTIYVSNSSQATLVKIPITDSGAAGQAEVAAKSTNCVPYGGGDGLDADSDGNVYTASNGNRIVRYPPGSGDGIVVKDGILDVPAAVKVWTHDGKKELLITNAALPPLRPSGKVDGARPGLLHYLLP